MNKEFDKRKKEFMTAALCLELGLDDKMIRETAKLYEINQTNLMRACAVLRSGSSLLRGMVELGLRSLQSASGLAHQHRQSFGIFKQNFHKVDTRMFDKQLKRELDEEVSVDCAMHTIFFLIENRLKTAEDGHELLNEVAEYLNHRRAVGQYGLR